MGPGARLALAGLVAGAALISTVALTAANTVPASRAGSAVQAITPNMLKPPACAAITVTSLRVGAGSFNGTGAAELVLGSAGPDTINARGGADCVLGGGGNDSLTGGTGTDICLGGPGTDTFSNCETGVQ